MLGYAQRIKRQTYIIFRDFVEEYGQHVLKVDIDVEHAVLVIALTFKLILPPLAQRELQNQMITS